jgi:ABC-type lipoprotein release transport system permease subunit
MHKLPAPRLSRNSYVKHRQDVILQIILPVAFVVVLILAVAVLVYTATFQGTGDVSTWAAIATIWIVIPLMALMVVLLVAACGVVYLLARLLKVSPHYTGIAQEYALWFNAQIVLWTDRIIEPILKFKAWVDLLTRKK